MRRSRSLPIISNFKEVEDENRECSSETPGVVDTLLQKETQDCQFQYRELMARIDQMEKENQWLITENTGLNEECRLNAERMKMLERERNAQHLQIRELECFLTDLQNVYEKAEKEKRTVTEELSRQRNGFIELECSKKDLEGQVQDLQASTEWRREEDDRVRKILQEHDLLRGELQEMHHHLLVKENELRNFQMLEAENHEMEIQISQMVQQIIQLRRQFNEVTQTKECLEQHNEALRDEMQNLKMESRDSTEVTPTIQCVLQDLDHDDNWSGDDDLHDVAPNDEDANSDVSEINNIGKIIPAGNNPARTPPPVSLAEEFAFSVCNPQPLIEDKDEVNSNDALDEYLRLTAAAVKIRFHMVPIGCDELIHRAKNFPFYRAHDELTLYMQNKLQEQGKVIPFKHKQDHNNILESGFKKTKYRVSLLKKLGSNADVRRYFSANKDRLYKVSSSVEKDATDGQTLGTNKQHSVVNKVFRRLFKQRSTTVSKQRLDVNS